MKVVKTEAEPEETELSVTVQHTLGLGSYKEHGKHFYSIHV